MSRLLNLRILNEATSFDKEKIESFERTLSHAPQFAYDESQEICVKLSDYGIQQYKQIYSYRPKPTKIIKNLYFFDCSTQQIIHYFSRFGKHAVVLYPSQLREMMHNYYSSAEREYRKITQNE